MAIIGIDVNETIEYVSEKDPDKKKPTVFVIGVITNKEKTRIMTAAAQNDGALDVSLFDLFKHAIREIRGLQNPKTGELETVTEITDDVLNMLPTAIILEVGGKALEFNGLTDTERKN